ARPDVTLVHRHFLAYPGYRDELLARGIDPATTGELVEYDLDTPDSEVARARPISLPRNVELEEPQTRRFAAWQAFLAAHRACRLAAPSVADEKLAEARVFFGEVSELASCAKLRSPIEP